MERRKTDKEECPGCGGEITGDHGQCPECGAYLERQGLLLWLTAGVVVLAVVTYLVVTGGA